MIWAIVGAAVVAVSLTGTMMSNVDEPKYTVLQSAGSIELREYVPVIAAETEVSGEREVAINEGFRRIADYIFGNNAPAQKIAMTAPVTQQAGEKIAMTAPVTQQAVQDKWKVRFIMPENYTLETLPKPNNEQVKLVPVPAKRFAVVRFSGLAGEDSLKRHTEELQSYMREQKLNALGEPVFAFYNPPWTLPFLRRNEVMVEVK